MLTMTFEQFYNGDYDDDDANLYVVRYKSEFYYIGISNISIWDRWFNYRMCYDNNLGWISLTGDTISRKIISNMPNSMNWNIDLWTLEECNDYLQLNRSNIKRVEPFFIGGLKPSCNYTYYDFNPNHIPENGYKNRYFEYIKLLGGYDARTCYQG